MISASFVAIVVRFSFARAGWHCIVCVVLGGAEGCSKSWGGIRGRIGLP